MNPFTIMVDTGCDLPDEYMDEHEIKTTPISFNIDGVQHDGGRWQEISAQDFYTALQNGSNAGTALINPGTYVEVFTDCAERGEALLVIALSSGLSGTYQNSTLALSEVKEKYPNCNIYTVDSLNACGGIGLLVMLAIRKREEGLSAAETAKWLNEKKNNCISLFTVDDLMFLHRGGRLSKVSAVAGRIIGIKPLLNVAPDGTLKLKDKARGRNGALERLVSQMKRCLDRDATLDNVIICHSNCIDDAKKVAALVRSAVSVKNVVITMMGPVIGAHTGPGTIALFFESGMTRGEYERKFYSK